VVYLLRSKKMGFIVDAAIYGFSIGAGFGVIENIYYLQSLTDQNLILWIIRGLGTAIMHSGTMAIFGIITKSVADRTQSVGAREILPGFIIAVVFHSFYNHFVFSPLLPTAFLIVTLPIVFYLSEKATRQWLGMGFDSDISLLEMIITGNIADTNVGKYLQSLRSTFPGEIVIDMLCLLRLHLELSIRAKGILLMRENGFQAPPDPEIKHKFDELRYLAKSVGKTGYLAISPFLRTGNRDLWQFYMLEKQ
ncbi:MAG: PrsW family intramembrane metalloprotease, partial [Ignavibacteriae bacterium]|nr:PrsW family intramembrane metalloprotease [Ignavibacteriota bacterium]